MSDKCGTYHCSWEAKDGKYTAWVVKHPRVRVTCGTIDHVWQKLGEKVSDHFDDMEAALDFDPPLVEPTQWDDLFKDGLRTIGWNAGAFYLHEESELFETPVCADCGWCPPERTERDVRIIEGLRSTDGALTSARRSLDRAKTRLLLLSERFIDCLTPTERSQFSTRPVVRSRTTSVKFYEIVPRRVIESVAIRGLEASGWRCTCCGYQTFSHGAQFDWGTEVIAQSDYDAAFKELFFIDPWGPRICMPSSRINELINAEMRQLSRGRLGVVADEACQRDPALPTWQSFGK